ncbi:hypothetical protein Trydic_g11319 [Trypoxylus dichotomus]
MFQELQEIAKQNKFVHILQIDLRYVDSYENFSKKVADIVKDEGLNVLFNNAGVSPKFARLPLARAKEIMDTYETNTLGPIMLTKYLLGLLKISAAKNSSKPLGTSKAAVINMSSILGSIQMNDSGGLYAYRCSKAALNMATKSMSIDLKKDSILVTAVHPGWVKTDMGGAKAPMNIEESTTAIVNLLDKLKEEHNGNFYQYDGQKVDW